MSTVVHTEPPVSRTLVDSGLSRPRSQRVILAGALSAMALGLGCTPLATYPPIEGTRTVEPWVHPVPEIMGVSIRHTRAMMNPAHPPIINLPPAVTASTWETVMSHVAPDARPMTDDDVSAFALTQVRLSGARAECDVVYPTPEGLPQMVTVGLRTDPFQTWRVEFTRRWRIPAEMPEPTFVPRQLLNQ